MKKLQYTIVFIFIFVLFFISSFMASDGKAFGTTRRAFVDQASQLSSEEQQYHFRELENLLIDFAEAEVNFGTHLEPLIVSVMNTHGPVFEMGSGVFSTGLLHHVTALCGNRRLLTADVSEKWIDKSLHYASERHEFIHVNYWSGESYSEFPEYSHEWDYVGSFIDWGVVFVDHDPPAERRGIDVYRLENRTEIMLGHDANYWGYHFNFTHFPNQYCFKVPYSRVATVVASMKVNVTKLFDGHEKNVFPCLYDGMCCRIPELFDLMVQYVNPDACYESTTNTNEWFYNRCRCYSLYDKNVTNSEIKAVPTV